MKPGIPSFSIILETENLATVNLKNVYYCLDSLAAQDISPRYAREVVMLNSGDLPEGIQNSLQDRYRWLQIKKISSDHGYYEVKMKGLSLIRGDVILFCDSDCRYEEGWLRSMLEHFSDNSDVQVLAGETSTKVENPYELAIAIQYFFPRFSSRHSTYIGKSYFMNNVAFRREFLMEHPIPDHLPIYRGNCLIHSFILRNIKKIDIWVNPAAKALHEPPKIRFWWRHLMRGHDAVICETEIYPSLKRGMDTLQVSIDGNGSEGKNAIVKRNKLIGIFKSSKWKKIHSVIKEDYRRVIMLPFALFFVFYLWLLVKVGRMIARNRPRLLLDRFAKKSL